MDNELIITDGEKILIKVSAKNIYNDTIKNYVRLPKELLIKIRDELDRAIKSGNNYSEYEFKEMKSTIEQMIKLK